MINLLLPIKHNKKSLQEIVEIIKATKKEICIRIMCEKNNPILQEKPTNSTYCTIDTFPVGTSEDSMISTTTKALPESDLIIVRENCQIFSTGAINQLLENNSSSDIVMFSQTKKVGKIKGWLYKVFKKMCKSFFNFTFFEGDIGIMFFSAKAHSILKETNVTKLTKINHWAGMNISYIPTNFETTKVPNHTPKSFPIKLGIYILALIAVTPLALFLLRFGILTLAIIGLYICALIALVLIILYILLKWQCYKKIGNLTCKRTDILERRNYGK